MKGRIIGREGRNIRSFEAATGVTVLIPVYNEAPILVSLVRRVTTTMDRLGLPYEVVIVNDGSTDATADHANHGIIFPASG